MNIAVLESGHVTQDDAAYPSLVRLDDDSIICGYSCGGGSMATGGTDWARSVDGGATWTREGTILPRVESPVMTNTLRLSRTPGGTVLAYGARRHDSAEAPRFGRDPSEPVICRSTDGGQSWSAPAVLPPDSLRASAPRAYEITCPILALDDRRWLASAALLADPKYLAGRVVGQRNQSARHGGDATFGIAGAAPVERAVFDMSREGIMCPLPAVGDVHHVQVGLKQDARRAPAHRCDQVGTVRFNLIDL